MVAQLALKRRVSHERLLWAVIGGVAAIVGGAVAWAILQLIDWRCLRQITARSAIHARADLTAHLQSRIEALSRLAIDCPPVAQLPPSCFDRLMAFLDEHAGCITIEFIDETFVPMWAISRAGLVDERANIRGETLPDRALQAAAVGALDGRPMIVPPGQGRPRSHIRIAVPLQGVRANQGFVAEVVDPTPALSEMLQNHIVVGYSITVLDGQGQQLYTSREIGSDNQSPWLEEIPIQFASAQWRLRVWPEDALVSAVRIPLHDVAVPLGALVGVLLTLAVRTGRRAQRTATELRSTQNELEQRVHDRTTELQTLSRMLMQLQDEERRRIAREIHDSTTQTLGAVYINLDRAKQVQRAGDTTELNRLLDEGAALLDAAIKETRTLAYLLHPPMIDDLGLAHALAWFVKGFIDRTGIQVRLDIQGDPGRLGGDVELALFRVAQEALSNIHRHSGSAVATLTLCASDQTVTLEISDRGRGIGAIADQAHGASIGVGITGMRERVRQLGGQFVVESSGEGTTIRVVLPTDESAQRRDRSR
jgi:signal transduction histidine kinase